MNVSSNKTRRALAAALATPLGLAAFSAAPATADTATIAPDMIVTASPEPLPTREVASSYTIITAAEIKAHQYRSITEALNGVPGLHLVQQGGEGKVTSVFSRGSNSNQTLVLINGQNVTDPSAPTGAFNFADLTLDNVERIEVVRGPQSALYGSQAMGAVINIITKRGHGAPKSTLRVEAGTLGTLNTSLTSGGSLGKTDYFVSLSRQANDGNDVTPARYRFGAAKEKDPYENVTGSLRLDTALNEYLTASAFAQIVDARTALDTELPENLYNEATTHEFYFNSEVSGRFLDGAWRPKLSFAFAQTNRKDTDRPDIYSVTMDDTNNRGNRITAKLDNTLDLADWNSLSFGGQFTRDEFSVNGRTDFGGFVQTPDASKSETATAFYISDHASWGERWFATASGRFDSPADFENAATFTIAPGYYHPETDTRLTVSYGTAFKVPSLFQRYGYTPNNFGSAFFGNPNLKPERSRGWEAGIDQGLFDSRLRLGTTWFASKISDAISTYFLPSFDSTTRNEPSFRTHGLESYAQAELTNTLSLRLDYTFTVVDADVINSSLTRRPRHQTNVSTVWRPDALTNLSAEMQYVVPYLDIKRDTGAIFKPGGYAVFNLAASRQITESIEITAKIKNLFDKRYEPADGFEAPGIEALAGIAISF